MAAGARLAIFEGLVDMLQTVLCPGTGSESISVSWGTGAGGGSWAVNRNLKQSVNVWTHV